MTNLVKNSIVKYNTIRPHWGCAMMTPNQTHEQQKIRIETYRKKPEQNSAGSGQKEILGREIIRRKLLSYRAMMNFPFSFSERTLMSCPILSLVFWRKSAPASLTLFPTEHPGIVLQSRRMYAVRGALWD